MELEKNKETAIPASERTRIKESIRIKKEKQKLGQFEKPATECPECGSHRLVQDYGRAEIVCSECGLVIQDSIVDRGPEWRAFDDEQRTLRSRTGPAMTLTIHDKGLSTVIDWRDRDLSGKAISNEARSRFYKLRRWQRRIRVKNNRERGLRNGLSELERMISALGLPKIIHETSALMYRKALENNLIRGRSVEGVASATIYGACRMYKNPRTLDEIAEVSRVSRKEIGRTYRFISHKLRLKLPTSSPEEYLSRFCSLLDLPMGVQKEALRILAEAGKSRILEVKVRRGKPPRQFGKPPIFVMSAICLRKKNLLA